ncbi:DUF7577 domain-containing protein [Halorubrum salinum]|uniref:DUF7577 domain-containing protein n=1 Tax=Halorubrum salinum TaxID=767517 RepID=UPI0021117B45|nr:zinc ribbon domain-containing protein [Halorubrum salinum]
MTGEFLLPIAAVFAGTVALTLASAWFLLRREPGSDAVLGGTPPESADDGGAATGSASRAGVPPAEGAEGEPPPLDVDGETVACRHCGAENRPTFSYCRWCVRSGFAGEGSDATAGPTMTERSM